MIYVVFTALMIALDQWLKGYVGVHVPPAAKSRSSRGWSG
jgi:hypothetical protein